MSSFAKYFVLSLLKYKLKTDFVSAVARVPLVPMDGGGVNKVEQPVPSQVQRGRDPPVAILSGGPRDSS